MFKVSSVKEIWILKIHKTLSGYSIYQWFLITKQIYPFLMGLDRNCIKNPILKCFKIFCNFQQLSFFYFLDFGEFCPNFGRFSRRWRRCLHTFQVEAGRHCFLGELSIKYNILSQIYFCIPEIFETNVSKSFLSIKSHFEFLFSSCKFKNVIFVKCSY